MTSTYSTNKAIEEPANGDYVNTWSTPVNSNFNIIDKAFGGHLIINATGVSGTTALTTTQYQNLYILFSGTLSANVNYQVPSGVGGQWVVYNGTSGAFTLTLSSGGGGSSVTITQGTRTLIVSDGTNVTLSVNTVTSPGGADTSIQFNQSGVFGGSSNLAWNYGTNTLTVTGAANISGNVGIGTTTPSIKLSVVANTNSNDGLSVSNTSTGASAQAWFNVIAQGWTGVQLIQNQASGTAQLYTADNVSMLFATNATERMRISAAGNVGIGNSSPTTKLTVSGSGFNGGSGTFISTTNGNSVAVNGINAAGVNDSAYIYLTDGTNAGFVGLTAQNAPGTVGSMRFGVAGTEYARIQPNGNVGIGTNSPSYLLDVNGTGRFVGALLVNGTINAYYTGKSGLLLNEDSSGNVFINQQDNGPLILNTNNTERMRISAAGNVGIGTSNPDNFYSNAVPLAIVRNQNAATILGIGNGTVGASAIAQINIIGGTSQSYLYQQLFDNNGSPYFTNEYGSNVNYMKWGFGGTERMRITAAGNVGIGTNAPSYLLDVNGTGRFTGAVTTAALTASSLSLSTALSAANGGTGLTSSGANNNVLASNGTSWITASIQSLVSSCIAAVATAAGFSYSFGSNGYLVFPSWLSGIIFQWGNNSIGQNATITQSLPISFPTSFIMPFISQSSSAGTNNCLYAFTTGSLSSFSVTYSATSGGATYNYLAIGY